MGCFIFLFALIGPRVALFFVWVFTDFVNRAFDGWIVPALGMVFLPWTTLVYSLAYAGAGVSGIGWFFVALALFADVASYGTARGVRR